MVWNIKITARWIAEARGQTNRKGYDMNSKELTLGQIVYHTDLYWGHEPMKIVGLRETQVELEGDYSGGTHNVCQKDWMPISGVLLEESK